MKKPVVFVAVVAAVFGMLSAPAQAQTGVSVKIPFPFVVAEKNLPQGQYLITSRRDSVFVQDSNGRMTVVTLSNAVSGRPVGKTGQVVFQCYSRQCYLSEVWTPGQYAGRRLLKSRREQEAAKKVAPTYFALEGTGR